MFFSRIASLFSRSPVRTPEEMANVKQFIDGLLSTKKVVVISKSYCPYCHKAKAALDKFSIAPGALEWVEIDKREDCQDIQDYMAQLTGARSVPRVFIGGKFLGGGDDTVAAQKNGSLEKKLAEVGAI